MDKETIERFIRELDHAVPREGAQVRLEQRDSGPEESIIAGNPPGFLRLGIELLKAGIAPEPEPTKNGDQPELTTGATLGPADSGEAPAGEESMATDLNREELADLAVDLEYLYTPDSMIRFTSFRRGELKVVPPSEKGFPLDRLLTVGCFVFAAILAFFAIIGASEVLGWLKG